MKKIIEGIEYHSVPEPDSCDGCVFEVNSRACKAIDYCGDDIWERTITTFMYKGVEFDKLPEVWENSCTCCAFFGVHKECPNEDCEGLIFQPAEKPTEEPAKPRIPEIPGFQAVLGVNPYSCEGCYFDAHEDCEVDHCLDHIFIKKPSIVQPNTDPVAYGSYLQAFEEETGLKPSECELVTKLVPEGVATYVQKRS